MTVKRVSALLILAATLALGACSSDSKDSHAKNTGSTSATAAVTEAAFKTQVDKACKSSNSAIGAAAQKEFGQQQPQPDKWRTFMVDTVLPLIGQRVKTIETAPAPAADTAAVQGIVDAGNAAIASARQDPAQMSPSSRAPFAHFDDLVTAAGLSECTVGG